MFAKIAKENGMEDDDLDACLEDGFYEIDNTYKVVIHWSKESNLIKLKRNNMQVFTEVLTDYTDPETGNITIDCFIDDEPNSEGRVVAEVTPDGEVIRGKNPDITEADFQCPMFLQAVAEAKIEQENRKQKLVDDVIEDLKKSLAQGDYTVLDELLKFIPSKNLVQALPEEKWGDYQMEIK